MSRRRARAGLGARFRRLWAAAAVSNLGDGLVLAAFPLLAADIATSPAQVAGVEMARDIPLVLLVLVGGLAADRLDRRRVMVAVDLLRALAVAILAVFVLTDHVSIVLVWVAVAALGAGEAFYDASSQAMVASVVEPDHYERAFGRLEATVEVTNYFVGPALGGILFAAVAALPFFLDAGSFVVAAIVILGLRRVTRPTPVATTATRTVRGDLREAWRYVRRHPVLRALILTAGGWNFFYGVWASVIVLYVLEIPGVPEWGYGLMLAVGATGSTTMALVAGRLADRIGSGRLLLAMFPVAGLSALLLATTDHVVPSAIAFFLGGAAGVGTLVVFSALRVALTPDALRGRVIGFSKLAASAPGPLGALVGGTLATAIGLRAPYVVYAVGLPLLGLAVAPFLNQRTITEARSASVPR